MHICRCIDQEVLPASSDLFISFRYGDSNKHFTHSSMSISSQSTYLLQCPLTDLSLLQEPSCQGGKKKKKSETPLTFHRKKKKRMGKQICLNWECKNAFQFIRCAQSQLELQVRIRVNLCCKRTLRISVRAFFYCFQWVWPYVYQRYNIRMILIQRSTEPSRWHWY